MARLKRKRKERGKEFEWAFYVVGGMLLTHLGLILVNERKIVSGYGVGILGAAIVAGSLALLTRMARE